MKKMKAIMKYAASKLVNQKMGKLDDENNELSNAEQNEFCSR